MADSTVDNISGHNHKHSSRSDGLVFVLSVCLVVIEILGLLCNGIILTVYYKYSRLRTSTNLFILNLAVCNMLLAVLQLVLSTPSFFHKEWLYGDVGCIAYGFVHQYLISVAVITLAVIAFDRFCVITKPFRKLQTFIVTKPRARVLICLSHIYSFVLTFPLLVGWNELTPDSHKTGCYIHYSKRSPGSMAYAITSTILTCVLPLGITAFCYAKIYKSVRKSSRRCTLYKSQRNTIYKESGLRKKSLYHTRTARMISIVMFFFLLTWLPTRVAGLLAAFGCSVSPSAVYVCVFLAKSCVMYNAVVYVFLNHRFRAAFLHLTFVCREESRLRLTTDATNASVRNFGEILPSVVETNERSRVLSRKTLSQLSFIPVAEIPELSSCSGRLSNADVSRLTREPSETPREDSIHDRKSSLRVVDLKECDTVGVDLARSENGSCLNEGLQDEGIGSHFPRGGRDISETNNGLSSVEIGSHLSNSVGEDTMRSDTNKELSSARQDIPKFESSTAEQNTPDAERNTAINKSELSGKAHNSDKINYGFNNPGLHEDDEYAENDKNIENYFELDIRSLTNIA